MNFLITLRRSNLLAERKVYRFSGYRQGSKKRGQKALRIYALAFLPCRIAARRRSSRSSALLYPPREPAHCIIPLRRPAVVGFSM